MSKKEFFSGLLKWCFIGLVIGAAIDYRDTKTIGVSMNYIQSAKADCEKSGKECAMVFDFVPVEADYE
jgi:hypothetical protein